MDNNQTCLVNLTSSWQASIGDIECDASFSNCIISCIGTLSCSDNVFGDRLPIQCPVNGGQCTINCIGSRACRSSNILSNNCSHTQLNIYGNNAGRDLRIYAAHELHVHVDGEYADFYQSSIYAQSDSLALIDINCDGGELCTENTIFAANASHSVSVSCTGENSDCSFSNIHCPTHSSLSSSFCRINCSLCHEMNVFTLRGASDVEWQCAAHNDSCSGSKLFCGSHPDEIAVEKSWDRVQSQWVYSPNEARLCGASSFSTTNSNTNDSDTRTPSTSRLYNVTPTFLELDSSTLILSTEPQEIDIYDIDGIDDVAIRSSAATHTLNFIVSSLAFALCCITLYAVYLTHGRYKQRHRARRRNAKKLCVDEQEAVDDDGEDEHDQQIHAALKLNCNSSSGKGHHHRNIPRIISSESVSRMMSIITTDDGTSPRPRKKHNNGDGDELEIIPVFDTDKGVKADTPPSMLPAEDSVNSNAKSPVVCPGSADVEQPAHVQVEEKEEEEVDGVHENEVEDSEDAEAEELYADAPQPETTGTQPKDVSVAMPASRAMQRSESVDAERPRARNFWHFRVETNKLPEGEGPQRSVSFDDTRFFIQ
eukprot:CAMPEP_0197028982 /NCGR_PEP_ID=MMETSP1384-20130603/8537_1 /TAXON_ID=29189 /ORGANISM="Ammonia sp." /LENGTH=594 /DNA_ID=CAMNT_0042458069 /DNA_START=104 /DNA_END=1888 /DNA_ORIENTATION=+